MIKSLLRLFSRRPSAPVVRPPDPAPYATEQLDEFARREIREWLANPVTQRVLSLMERGHPGRNVPSMLPKNDADKDAAVCYLNRIRGWEKYRNDLLSILHVPDSVGEVEETYQTPRE